MVDAFLRLAVQSPSRQRAFRRAVWLHLFAMGMVVWLMLHTSAASATPFFGQFLLVTGIVEGALLIGWRLTQMPKSQALEFLLVTPLRGWRVFVGEALVGLGRLALVTLSGLPILLLLTLTSYVTPLDVVPLLVMPFTWGAITGLGLTTWAFEPLTVRRWSERFMLVMVLIYLAIGVLAGEHLKTWISTLPETLGRVVLYSFEAFHRYNPFSVMQYWMEQTWEYAWERTVGLEIGGLVLVVLLLIRSATRLHGHFHERHYRPIQDERGERRKPVSNRPLSWWAVRRVTEYSGRINLWLAGGFGVLYALYTVAGSHWPPWMGQRAFQIFDRVGGLPVLVTALVVLAAVPASYQYGLWDSNAQERCRRLELLLLTRLRGEDYWEAATAAAWRRGRGYFVIALILLLAAVLAGKMAVWQAAAAVAAGTILWGVYFAFGFRAFSRGIQANSMGILLTLGLPALAVAAFYSGWPAAGALLPPGAIYAAGTRPAAAWVIGPIVCGLAALLVARLALARCENELRRWYDQHHGKSVAE